MGQKQNLHLRRYSFVSVIIRNVSKKQIFFLKECQNWIKNDRVMLIRRSRVDIRCIPLITE